ncbi:ATP-grasp domain-containing protein [Tundrisphaera sp. TA3]|uniref:ATP-grasp domain-containing protein n=1 Tax=Tundrisphaera sp. TA3 TaxID=3435775 RepID=UPI003EBE3541
MALLILGASARAAAFSALRIGLRPDCADLFSDLDLARACPATRVDFSDYPSGLAAFAATRPPSPCLYTGALENRPDLVDEIAARHRLLGNAGPALRAVRDPLAVAALLRADGLAAPDACRDPEGLPRDGSWLAKPLASAGGHGIRPWTGGIERPGRYYQRRIQGLPLSAIYVAEGGRCRLAGITRQFVGGTGDGPRVAYRGSLGPWPVASEVSAEVERIGAVLASAFPLAGIFGVDLILSGGRAWAIEVNPRYTASVEVLEWASGLSVLARHLRACGFDFAARPHPPSPGRFVAKAILRADRRSRWMGHVAPDDLDPDAFPEIGDIPHPGTTFEPGEPVLTAFAAGETPADCRRRLSARLRHHRGRLSPVSPPGC